MQYSRSYFIFWFLKRIAVFVGSLLFLLDSTTVTVGETRLPWAIHVQTWELLG